MDLMLDAFIGFFGIYLIYCAVNMKRTGEIAKGIMVRKDADLSAANDIPGFIQYMYGKTIVVGICTIVCGGMGCINDIYGGLGMVQLGMTIVFFVAVIVFGLITVKAQRKYLGI